MLNSTSLNDSQSHLNHAVGTAPGCRQTTAPKSTSLDSFRIQSHIIIITLSSCQGLVYSNSFSFVKSANNLKIILEHIITQVPPLTTLTFCNSFPMEMLFFAISICHVLSVHIKQQMQTPRLIPTCD